LADDSASRAAEGGRRREETRKEVYGAQRVAKSSDQGVGLIKKEKK